MAGATTDLFQQTFNATNPNVGRVTGTRAGSGTSLSVDNLSGWPTGTGVSFSTYKIDTNNKVIAGTQIDWVGLVTGSTSIGSLTRVAGASDTGSVIGDVVEMNPTATWADRLIRGILTQHNQDGSHSSITTTGYSQSSGTFSVPIGTISNTALATGIQSSKLSNPYKINAYLNATQSVPASSSATIIFNTKLYDTGTNYNTTTGVFTAQVAGFYHFDLMVAVNSGATGEGYVLDLKKNGTSIAEYTGFSSASGSATTSLPLSTTTQLAANDAMTVTIFNSTTGSKGILGTQSQTYLCVNLVSAT